MIRLKTFIISLLVASASMADGTTQNLLQLYQQAKINDNAWAAARSTYEATQEKLVQGKSLILPSVNLEAYANHTNSDLSYHSGVNNVFSSQGGGNQSFESYGYSLNLNQPLFRKQNWVQFEQAKIQVSQAEQQLQIAMLDLMVRSAQVYFDVLQAQDSIDLIEAQKNATTEQLEQAKANFEVGTATITDVHEAQARYDLLIAQEIAARNNLKIRKHTIQSITGEMPNRLAAVKESLNVTVLQPTQIEQWVELAEQHSPQLVLKQKTLQLATQDVSYARAGHLPIIDAVGSFSDSRANGSTNNIGTDTQKLTIGLQLQWPLYRGGAINSKEREAILNEQKFRDELEQTRREVSLQTRQAYLNVTSAMAEVKAFEQALSSSNHSLDSTLLGYEVGVRTSIDVLNAQQQFYSAKRDLLQARYAWLLSIIKLRAAAGLLTEQNLAETSNMLAE